MPRGERSAESEQARDLLLHPTSDMKPLSQTTLRVSSSTLNSQNKNKKKKNTRKLNCAILHCLVRARV